LRSFLNSILLVAVVIGGAFTAVVNSLVNDIITPVISLIVKKNLENWFYVIRKGRTPGATYSNNLWTISFMKFFAHPTPTGTPAEANADGAVTENIGRFLQTIFNFVIIGWILFIIVKGMLIASLIDHSASPTSSSLLRHSEAS
jgi:large conductance mechanosensitive channel